MKDLEFLGTSLEDLKAIDVEARHLIGYQLHRVQHNQDPSDSKPMTPIGAGVREIRVKTNNQYRVIYIAKLVKTVYVLHVFEKKTQKTSQKDIELAKQRFKLIKR